MVSFALKLVIPPFFWHQKRFNNIFCPTSKVRLLQHKMWVESFNPLKHSNHVLIFHLNTRRMFYYIPTVTQTQDLTIKWWGSEVSISSTVKRHLPTRRNKDFQPQDKFETSTEPPHSGSSKILQVDSRIWLGFLYVCMCLCAKREDHRLIEQTQILNQAASLIKLLSFWNKWWHCRPSYCGCALKDC